MCFFLERGGGGRKLLGKALPWILVVFCLLVIATLVTPPSVAAPSVAAPSVAAPSVAAPSVAAPSVAAPSVAAPLVADVSRSVSSAVQETSSTEEVVALQEIARTLKRMVTNYWKISLFAFWGSVGIAVLTMLTGVVTQYLADLGRKKCPHWNSLTRSSLEDECTRCTQQLAQQAVLGVQARTDEGTNRKGDVDESLSSSRPYNKNNGDFNIMPPVETEPVQKKGRKQSRNGGCTPAAYAARRQAGYGSA